MPPGVYRWAAIPGSNQQIAMLDKSLTESGVGRHRRYRVGKLVNSLLRACRRRKRSRVKPGAKSEAAVVWAMIASKDAEGQGRLQQRAYRRLRPTQRERSVPGDAPRRDLLAPYQSWLRRNVSLMRRGDDGR